MKKIFILFFILLISRPLKAQLMAITDTGNEVYLYEDGTWRYVVDSLNFETEILFNEVDFFKDDSQSFLIKSSTTNTGIYINPKKWTFSKAAPNEDQEYNFELKNEDLYALLISERLKIPLENLKTIAFENAKAASSDIRITKEEFRKVNGLDILMLKMEGTISGLEITYCGYYYSDSSGTNQLITYTGSGLFDDYEQDIEEFLNGFVIVYQD